MSKEEGQWQVGQECWLNGLPRARTGELTLCTHCTGEALKLDPNPPAAPTLKAWQGALETSPSPRGHQCGICWKPPMFPGENEDPPFLRPGLGELRRQAIDVTFIFVHCTEEQVSYPFKKYQVFRVLSLTHVASFQRIKTGCLQFLGLRSHSTISAQGSCDTSQFPSKTLFLHSIFANQPALLKTNFIFSWRLKCNPGGNQAVWGYLAWILIVFENMLIMLQCHRHFVLDLNFQKSFWLKKLKPKGLFPAQLFNL